MLERVHHLEGEILDVNRYIEDFSAHWNDIGDVFWKLERVQTFREPGNDSWEAWVDGRWEDALAIIEGRRPALIRERQEDEALGIESRRLRIVGLPVTPYLQWELNSLKVRAETSERIRVLSPAALAGLEADRPLPELTILGAAVMYEVLYDETGTVSGARKFNQLDVIRKCRADLEPLFTKAEDLLAFFERELSHLPPPISARFQA